MNTDQVRNIGGNGLGDAVDTMESAAEQMESAFSRSKEQLAELQEKAMEISKAACDNANKYVKENPWQAVGIAAGIGLVAGLLLRRR